MTPEEIVTAYLTIRKGLKEEGIPTPDSTTLELIKAHILAEGIRDGADNLGEAVKSASLNIAYRM